MRIFIGLLFIVSCGNQVELNNKLENISTVSEPTKLQKAGVIIKSDESKITYQGKTYFISKYSSKSALEFLKSQPSNININVVFVGGFQGDQAVLESIKLQ